MINPPKEPSGMNPGAAWCRQLIQYVRSLQPISSRTVRVARGTNGSTFEALPQASALKSTSGPFHVSATADPTVFSVSTGKAIMPLVFPTSTTQDIFNPEFCFLRYDYPGGTITIDDWTDIPSVSAHSFCVLWLELKQDKDHPETVTPSLVKQFSDGANNFIIANGGKGAPPVMTRLDDQLGDNEWFCIPLALIEATSVDVNFILLSSQITQYQSAVGQAFQYGAGNRCLRYCGNWKGYRLYQPFDMVIGTVGGGFPTPGFYFNTAVNDNNAPGAIINNNYGTGNWYPL